jgi:hypothetical protein
MAFLFEDLDELAITLVDVRKPMVYSSRTKTGHFVHRTQVGALDAAGSHEEASHSRHRSASGI